MKESQYTDSYLQVNKRRGLGNGYTPQTFLHYRLHGTAKSWSGRYLASLRRSLDRRVAEGRAISGISCKGGDAYYPI